MNQYFSFFQYSVLKCKTWRPLFAWHKLYSISDQLPVFEMLGLHLGHLATGEVKHLFTEQFEDDHVVLTETLTGPTCTHNITYKSGPVFGPFLLQDLKVQK